MLAETETCYSIVGIEASSTIYSDGILKLTCFCELYGRLVKAKNL